ncbi:MAG: lipoyl synthase [Verrucomicrobiales bacterium]|nr:lipoyl synthase [Verrucomicrobiales bacterium]
MGRDPKPDALHACTAGTGSVSALINSPCAADRADAARHRRFPHWLRTRLYAGEAFGHVESVLRGLKLHTVCESARCPNRAECWGRGTATFLICGNRCTRSCRFCAVQHGTPEPLDPAEPSRVAEAARRMQLGHVVITSVTRDDLPDGGAAHFAEVIRAVRALNPQATIEVLTPDFGGSEAAIQTVLDAAPDVFNHNLETVRRLTPSVRSKACYDRSLHVLQFARARGPRRLLVKSGLMLGLGETETEVIETLQDLRTAGCDAVTLGQYLQPTPQNLPIHRFVTPEEFAKYARLAERLGFIYVASGPLVRSSYHAEEAL